jgi:hypothetical protein
MSRNVGVRSKPPRKSRIGIVSPGKYESAWVGGRVRGTKEKPVAKETRRSGEVRRGEEARK